jgi:hypothetical protein
MSECPSKSKAEELISTIGKKAAITFAKSRVRGYKQDIVGEDSKLLNQRLCYWENVVLDLKNY